jgi:hypothetical protein
MCKCQIAWIDSFGKPTPDYNEAIGLAVCHDPGFFGEEGSEPIPICEEHAKQIGKFWHLIPLEGQSIEQAHELVQKDRYFKIIPDVVSASIRERFADDADAILNSLRWSGDHFAFNKWGMYVGVELDGHIHT